MPRFATRPSRRVAQRGRNSPAGRIPILDTLAAAYAEAGRFAEAVQTAQQALELASSGNDIALADALRTDQALPGRFTLSRSAVSALSKLGFRVGVPLAPPGSLPDFAAQTQHWQSQWHPKF